MKFAVETFKLPSFQNRAAISKLFWSKTNLKATKTPENPFSRSHNMLQRKSFNFELCRQSYLSALSSGDQSCTFKSEKCGSMFKTVNQNTVDMKSRKTATSRLLVGDDVLKQQKTKASTNLAEKKSKNDVLYQQLTKLAISSSEMALKAQTSRKKTRNKHRWLKIVQKIVPQYHQFQIHPKQPSQVSSR